MANVLMVFGILLLIGLAYPASLLLYWLAFPDSVERVSARVEAQPWRCFWIGFVLLVFVVLLCAVLLSAGSGMLQLLGWLLIVLTLGVALIGSAGLAAALGQRWRMRTPTLAPSAAFLRSALALEFAVLLPAIGWLIVLPAVVCLSLGAAVRALGRATPALASTLVGEA